VSPLDPMDVAASPWSIAGRVRPCAGQIVSGDTFVVVPCRDHVIVAVVDALGHGPEAHDVANRASDSLQGCFVNDPVAIIERLHRDLQGTRGSAATVCVLSPGRIDGCGVGNCEVRSTVRELSPLLTHGVLGSRMGKPRRFGGALVAGDRVVLYSDGVRGREWPDEIWNEAPENACRSLIERCGRSGDDATALIVEVKA